MTTELINYSDPGVIETLKKTIAVDTTDHELALFLQVCKSTGLNPFNKEIWVWKHNGKLNIQTGNAGYWQIANSIDSFDGVDSGFDYDKDGNLVSAWCSVYRKDRSRPTKGIAMLKECRKTSPIWNERPSMMLLKCAENIALKKAFPHELNKLDSMENSEVDQNYVKNVTGITTDYNQKVIEAPSQPLVYDVPAVTKEQSLFMQKRNFKYDEKNLVWIAPLDVDEKTKEKMKPYIVPSEKLKALMLEGNSNA